VGARSRAGARGRAGARPGRSSPRCCCDVFPQPLPSRPRTPTPRHVMRPLRHQKERGRCMHVLLTASEPPPLCPAAVDADADDVAEGEFAFASGGSGGGDSGGASLWRLAALLGWAAFLLTAGQQHSAAHTHPAGAGTSRSRHTHAAQMTRGHQPCSAVRRDAGCGPHAGSAVLCAVMLRRYPLRCAVSSLCCALQRCGRSASRPLLRLRSPSWRLPPSGRIRVRIRARARTPPTGPLSTRTRPSCVCCPRTTARSRARRRRRRRTRTPASSRGGRST
jgi:hypothetical protein